MNASERDPRIAWERRSRRSWMLARCAVACASCVVACSPAGDRTAGGSSEVIAGEQPSSGGSAAGGTSAGGTGAGLGGGVIHFGGAGPGDSGQMESTVEILDMLPDGFTPADLEHPDTSQGGFDVLGPLSEVPAPEGECGNILRVIVRDFQASHDDFENAGDWSTYEVKSPIGESRKPEKTSTNGPLHIDQWYQNLEGVNQPFAVDLWLVPVGETFVFDSSAFFPLNDWGNKDQYLFTTELHTNFEYKGGEVFTFRGDDDVFVFINGHLAVNLSGVHVEQTGSVDLDQKASEFGLQLGSVYTFDLFQAERQPGGSNFRVETTLDFTGCGVVLPSDVIR